MRRIEPLRLLAHPLFWVALALLILNDHFLKGAGILPEAATGKLSDFAGMLVAPAVLFALLGGGKRGRLLAAHLLIGLGFAAINIWPEAAAAFTGMMALTPFPWAITVDPSDLIALPVLVYGYRVYATEAGRKASLQPWHGRLGFALGALACLATSQPIDRFPPEPFFGSTGEAHLVVANSTGTFVSVQVRPLRTDIEVDCVTVLGDPSNWLTEANFDPGNGFEVGPDQGLPLVGAGACSFFLIELQGGPNAIVGFDPAEFEKRLFFPPFFESGSPDDQQILFLTRENGIVWPSHGSVFEPPHSWEPPLDPACQLPEEGQTLDWSDRIPDGPVTVSKIAEESGGCVGLRVREAPFEEWFHVCSLPGLLPFEEGETVTFELFELESDTTDLQKYLIMESDKASMTLSVGPEPPLLLGLTHKLVSLASTCSASMDACEVVARPMEIHFYADSEEPRFILGAGDMVSVDENRDFALLRAQQNPVISTTCSPQLEAFTRIESVVIERFEE